MPAVGCGLFLVRKIGVLRGLTNGLAFVLEHLDWMPLGDCGPGEMGVKLKFFLLVLGLGGTESSGAGVSKLTLLFMLPEVLGKLPWWDMGVMYVIPLCVAIWFKFELVKGVLFGTTTLSSTLWILDLFSAMPFCSSNCLSVEILDVFSDSTVSLTLLLLKYLDNSSSCWLLFVPENLWQVGIRV